MKQVFKCEKCNEEFNDKYECQKHEKLCGKDGEDFVYVAECFITSQTYHENPRFYKIFKKTVIISDEFIEKFREIKNEKDYETVNELMYDDLVQNELPDKFTGIIIEGMASCGDFDKENVSYIIDNKTFMEYYSDDEYYPNDDLVAEIHFKCYYKDDDELGTAFLSVYKLEKEKLEKQDDVDIEMRKWITDNIDR